MEKFIKESYLIEALSVFKDKENGNCHFLYGIETAKEIVSEAPSEYVTVVVHAAWDANERCTACKERSTEDLDGEKWNYWMPPYCPHCGAKMDLEEHRR